MVLQKKRIAGTPYKVLEERLSTLCKLYREDEEGHFAQFYVQTSNMGECVVKGLESPNLSFKERKKIHDIMWGYMHDVMGYKIGSIQRVKWKPKPVIVTSRKSLNRYSKRVK